MPLVFRQERQTLLETEKAIKSRNWRRMLFGYVFKYLVVCRFYLRQRDTFIRLASR